LQIGEVVSFMTYPCLGIGLKINIMLNWWPG
jgi:hypothetical protein